MDMTSPGGRLQPRNGLYRFLPFYGNIRLIRVVDNAEVHGRQYCLGRLCRFWSSQLVALHELADAPNTQFLDILLKLRRLHGDRHANIQEVFGVCNLGDRAFTVASYSDKGRLLPYLRATPALDRRDFVLHVATGLEFLHAHGVVHGDLCSRNIYISHSDHAVLSGFPNPTTSALESACSLPAPLGDDADDWREPREADDTDAPHEFLVDPNNIWITRRPVFADGEVDSAIRSQVDVNRRSSDSFGDVFALGILIVEIFIELAPADSQSALRLLRMARKGQRPPHPGPVAKLRGLDCLHWDLCLRCWTRDVEVRVTSQQLAACLRQAENIIRPAFEWKTEDLAAWVTSRVPRLRRRITDAHDIRDGRDAERGLYEVEGNVLNPDGSLVPVKIVSPFIARRCTMRRRHDFLTEAFVWSQLEHPNIMPLLGTTYYEGTNNCFVVPWTVGSCVDFLSANPAADRLKIMVEVADALHYLHTRAPTIVHRYVRARHVLVDPDGIAFLAAFDFQHLYDPETPYDDSWYDTQSKRWDPAESNITGATTKVDVYGFAMFAYEIFSGNVPMHDLPDTREAATMDYASLALWRGKRPDRPDHAALTDTIWDIIQRCWNPSPRLRPSMGTVATQLRQHMTTR